MVNVTAALRHARHAGIRAAPDLPNFSNPWQRRRVFLVIGLVVGVFVVATLVWGCIDREGR